MTEPTIDPGLREQVGQILARAREILDPREAWTKRQSARDATGRVVPATGPEATCFCVLGACDRAMKGLGLWGAGLPSNRIWNETVGVLDGLTRDDRFGAIAYWNDAPARTHDDVLELLDRAVQVAA